MSQTRQDRGVEAVREDIVGQGGTIVPVNEVRYTPDQAILDPNSPLAVQVPEGVGADGSRTDLNLANVLAEGHVEAKFGTVAGPEPVSSEAGEHPQGSEFVPDQELIVTPEVHNEPEIVRTANVTRDVEAESYGSTKEPVTGGPGAEAPAEPASEAPAPEAAPEPEVPAKDSKKDSGKSDE